MLEFARTSNRFPDVTFVHKDATDLSSYSDHSFDYATALMLMHELPGPQQILVLKEALRVGKKVGFFAELGIGYKGILAVGLSGQF